MDLPAKAAALLKAAAQIILKRSGTSFEVPGELSVATACTDGLLVVAWEAIESIIEEPRPTTRVLYQVLAQLVGAALIGADAQIRLTEESAERAGRRLQKQAVKVQMAISTLSSKAAQARAAMAKDAEKDTLLQVALGTELAASESREQAALRELRGAPYSNFPEIATPPPKIATVEPEAAVMLSPDSRRDAECKQAGEAELHSSAVLFTLEVAKGAWIRRVQICGELFDRGGWLQGRRPY